MYLIDGYNLYYNTDFDSPELMVDALDKFCAYRKKGAKVVFDGYSDSDLNTNCVQVEHVGDADVYLQGLIAENNDPSYYVLITSDKELVYHGKRSRIKVIKSEEFDFSLPEVQPVDIDEKEDFFMTESEVQKQLEEFNNFKK
jgi:hypothetical protein